MTTSPEPQEDSDFATRYNLQQALNQLPWSGQIDVPPRWDQGNDGQFMAQVADWLTTYRNHLRIVQDTTHRNAVELNELRDQRNAARAFLGLPLKGTT